MGANRLRRRPGITRANAYRSKRGRSGQALLPDPLQRHILLPLVISELPERAQECQDSQHRKRRLPHPLRSHEDRLVP